MAWFETWFKNDLAKPINVVQLQGVMFNLDNLANKIGVELEYNGQPAALEGTIAGYVIRNDGTTLNLTANTGKDGNKAWIILPQEAYTVEGPISIVIKLVYNSAETTIGACAGYVTRSRTSSEIAPTGTVIPSLASLEAAIAAANAAAANAADATDYIAPTEEESTASAAHAVGSYFIYNGKLMKATSAIAQGATIVPYASGVTHYNCAEVPGGLSGDVYNLTNTANAAANNAADAQQLVAPVESTAGMPTSVATMTHATGSYFVFGGVLYKATADIATGDPIVTTGTGANAAQVPGGVMGEVADLKSAFNDLSDAIFADAFLKLTKESDAFTVEVNRYANSYGKQELSGYNLYYFTAQKDFEYYCDEATLQNGQALSIGIYNGNITQSGFVRQYRRGDNNLPTIANKATISAGQIFAVSIYTPSSSPEDFGIYANYKYDTLNNDVKLNTNQIDQVLNEINPKPNEIATFGYRPYQRLTKSSSVFTVENNTYATTGDKVSLSGYQLLYFTASIDFDFYFDENTLGETFGLFFSVYNGSIASGNNVYCKRRDNNDLPSDSNKAHILAGQILAISIYTPTSSPADFVGYANYESFLQLTNSVYLNQLQLDQVGGTASYKNYAYNKKIAWFGDSISEMRQLPHTTGSLLSATVYDCSFRGSCIGRTYSNYNEFSFSHLVTSIIAGDFSAQWTQLEAKEQEEGHAMPWLRENLTTLESIDFSEIDYVVLLQGTNDFGIPINAQSPYTSRVAEMKGLMDDAVGRLITFAPQIKFYIFTPFYRGDITEDNYHNTIADYVSAEIEVAGKYAIPVYNLLTNSRICQQTRLTYLNSADLVHPNEYGDSYLAEVCAKYIGTH